MIAVITSLELKSPLKFFALSYQALQIIKQLKPTSCVKYKSRGFWTLHYTMTLWNSTEEMKAFAKSGAHLEAMKKSTSIAKEIRTLTITVDSLPAWKDAKTLLLKEGKVLRF
jgi:hypothetical protein